jgi:hypothetical protein
MNIIKLNSISQTPHYTNFAHKDRFLRKPFRYSQRNNILCHNDKKESSDNKLFISSTLVLSSILFLSTSIVLVLSAREMNIEAERLQDKYDKLQQDIRHLEEKNIQDEIIINAIVGKILELRSIGIV